jgi:O-antigen/teichoic acid export membrane protein
MSANRMLLPVSDSPHPENERGQAKNVPWWLLTGAGVLTQLLTMASGIIAARMLGVEGRGQLLLVVTLGTIASQLTLGGSLPNAITKQLAERGVRARDGLKGMTRRWTPVAIGAGAIAAGYYLFLEWDGASPDKYLLAVGVLLFALQAMASRVLMGAMLGEYSRPVHIALTGVLPQAVVVLVLGTALAIGVDWTAVTVGCTVLVLLARLRLLARPTGRPEDRLDSDELSRLARRTHVGSVGPIDGLGIDRLLVGTLLGTAPLGLYSVAVALASLNNILGMSLGMLALPRVAALQKDPPAETRYVRDTLVLSMLLLGFVVAALELVLSPLIRLTFGEEFVGATATARWIVVASGLLGFRRVLIGILQGRDKGRFASVVEILLMPVLVAGVLVAAVQDSLVLVGVTMTVTGAAACAVLGFAVLRSAPQPAEDASESADTTAS